MPPGYAWPEDLIDSRNWSRDTRFCRCTVFKSPSCVAELFFLPLYGGFPKWWYPKTMGCPAKMIILGCFGRYHHLRKHPYSISDDFSWNGSSCERSLRHAPCLCPTQLKPQHDQHHGSLDLLLNQLEAQKKSGALGDFQEFPPSGPFLL